MRTTLYTTSSSSVQSVLSTLLNTTSSSASNTDICSDTISGNVNSSYAVNRSIDATSSNSRDVINIVSNSSSSSSSSSNVSTYNQDALNTIVLKAAEKGKSFTEAEKYIFNNIYMNKFSGKEVVWMDFWRYYLDECKKHIIVNGTDDVYFRSKDQLKERMKTIKRIVDAGTENKSVHIKNFFTTQS